MHLGPGDALTPHLKLICPLKINLPPRLFVDNLPARSAGISAQCENRRLSVYCAASAAWVQALIDAHNDILAAFLMHRPTAAAH
jgi:hypothetical protein